jgi:hypothetical protein
VKQKILTSLLLVTLVFCGSSVIAKTTTNTQLLIHGFSEKSGWSVCGWSILPNYSKDPTKSLVVGGVRHNSRCWWVEMMTGLRTIKNQSIQTIDLRGSFQFSQKINFWGELNYFWSGDWYSFFEANIFVVGIETENNDTSGKPDDLSVGVHAKLPLGNIVLICAYQWHNDDKRQTWFRTVINLKNEK